MKRAALFLVLLLSSAAYAECGWQGDWIVCPGAERTDKYSKAEILSGLYGYRYWQVADFNGLRSWSRYYEVDCKNRTIKTLQADMQGKWIVDWEFIERRRQAELSTLNYIMPDSMESKTCAQIDQVAAQEEVKKAALKPAPAKPPVKK